MLSLTGLVIRQSAGLLQQGGRLCHPAVLSLTAALRQLSTSQVRCLKEIVEDQKGDVTVVEGIRVKSDREDRLLKGLEPDACTLCRLNLDLKYTDVLILSQFLRADGCLLPRRLTGVCREQQEKLEKLVNQAQRAGLLPTYRPDLTGRERTSIRSTYKWKKYNVYFEDD